jgi:anti-sigma factor RsiW
MITDHDQIRELLHVYVDGELDLINARDFEQHLQTCKECQRMEKQIRELHTAVTNAAPAYRAPAHLRRNVRAALRREARADDRVFSPWLIMTGAACVLLLFGAVLFQTARTSENNAIADQVIANHVRSLLATHLLDVASSDQHTVKPWFEGKIDFAPAVTDFASQGFPLIGGRLDYLNGRTVAVLVYQRNKHPINLFVAPISSARDSSPSFLTRRGYNLLRWTRNGMEYWAISDLNETELRQFAAVSSGG